MNLVSSSHNLSGDGTCGFSDSGSLQNANPQLGSLADNGGPTNTLKLADASPAKNAGDNNGCPASDQRGIARPQAGICDIGAVELGLRTCSCGKPCSARPDAPAPPQRRRSGRLEREAS